MADVFISYKREDRAAAEALDRALTEAGFSCWWDTSLVAGEHFNEAIQRELAAARCVLVLWTKASHASQWVQAEAIDGFNRKILVAARLDDVALQYPYGIVQTADLRRFRAGADHPGVAEVIAGVAGKVGRSARLPSVSSPVHGGGGERERAGGGMPPPSPRPSPSTGGRGRMLALGAGATALVALTAVLVWQPWRSPITNGPQDAELFTPERIARVRERVSRERNALLRDGQTFRDCADCPEMVVIPGGSFTMGSPESEANRESNEGPQRRVSIRQFAVGKYEVTFDDWAACANNGGCTVNPNPSDEGWGRGRRPVINVSWNEAQEYVRWLSQRTGERYRLLTEAEWEYAARAGTTTPWSWGGDANAACQYGNLWDRTASSDSPATCSDGVGSQTAPVGRYQPNAFGLYDMHGNVWGWVQDCYADSYAGAATNGSAVETSGCSSRVLRGGSWGNNPLLLRSAVRGWDNPTDRNYIRGFRLARTV